MAARSGPRAAARAANLRVEDLNPDYVAAQRKKGALPPEPADLSPTPGPDGGPSPGPRAPRPAKPSLRRPLGGRLGGGVGETGAGVILGMVAYALVLAAVQYGPSGPLLWLRAKFLNQPAPPPAGSGAAAGGLQGPPFPYGGVY